MEAKSQLPRATAEMAHRYNEMKQLDIEHLSHDQLEALNKEYAQMVDNYDWLNYEFTDPATGKVGLKDAAGDIIVPARYDGACYYEHYMGRPHAPHVMMRDGKCGIVAADGTGNELTKFEYSNARPIAYTPFYAVWHQGDDKHFGIITPNGTILVDDILSKVYEASNAILVIERDGKQGLIDLNTLQVVMPQYDEVDIEPGEYVTFTKDGVKGRVDTEGKFYTLEEADRLDLPNDDIDILFASEE